MAAGIRSHRRAKPQLESGVALQESPHLRKQFRCWQGRSTGSHDGLISIVDSSVRPTLYFANADLAFTRHISADSYGNDSLVKTYLPEVMRMPPTIQKIPQAAAKALAVRTEGFLRPA